MSIRRAIICVVCLATMTSVLQIYHVLVSTNVTYVEPDGIFNHPPELLRNNRENKQATDSENASYPSSIGDLILKIQTRLQEAGRRVREQSTPANNSCPSRKYPKLRHLVLPRQIGYFQKVNEYIPGSETVLYHSGKWELERFISRDVFIPVSNDCKLTEAKARLNLINRTGCIEQINHTRLTEIPWVTLAIQENPSYLPQSEGVRGAIRRFVHVIPDAAVNGDGEVIFRNIKVVPERCEMVRVVDNCFRTNATYDEVFVVTQFWGFGFFHGAVEGLTKLSPFLRFLQEHPDIKIHVGGRHPYLSLLNLDSERFIVGPVWARVLYVPGGTPCFTLPFFTGQLLSWQLQRTLHRHDRDTIILIKRSKKRWLQDHEAIYRMLERHAEHLGLSVVVYDDSPVPPLRTAMDLFHRAVAVISPHGAGLTNMLFSQPGTLIFEVLCHENDTSERIQLCYQRMATVLGMRYYGHTVDNKCRIITAADIERPFIEYMILLGYMQS